MLKTHELFSGLYGFKFEMPFKVVTNMTTQREMVYLDEAFYNPIIKRVYTIYKRLVLLEHLYQKVARLHELKAPNIIIKEAEELLIKRKDKFDRRLSKKAIDDILTCRHFMPKSQTSRTLFGIIDRKTEYHIPEFEFDFRDAKKDKYIKRCGITFETS